MLFHKSNVLFVGVGFLAYFGLWPQPMPLPDVILPSIVQIEVKQGSATDWGSGVAIGDAIYRVEKTARHSLILTALHVVGDSKLVTLHYGEEAFLGTVIKTDPKDDLALIETEKILPSVKLATSYHLGQEVWAVGFPMAQGLAITQGYLSSQRDFGLEATASVYPGNSGGGLFIYDHGYKLVGVVDALMLFPTPLAQLPVSTVEFSVSVEKVRKFLEG